MKEQELGYLVAAGISFVKHQMKMPVYLKHADGLHQNVIDNLLTKGSHENEMVFLPEGKYYIGIGKHDHTLEFEKKSAVGDKVRLRYLHLQKGDVEFVVGHSDSSVFLREGRDYQWKRVRMQGEPSLGNLVKHVIREAAGIPTIVARGYDRDTQQPGRLRVLDGYKLYSNAAKKPGN